MKQSERTNLIFLSYLLGLLYFGTSLNFLETFVFDLQLLGQLELLGQFGLFVTLWTFGDTFLANFLVRFLHFRMGPRPFWGAH